VAHERMRKLLGRPIMSADWRSDRPAPRHQALHDDTARQLRSALRRRPGIVITTVPYHLPSRTGHSHMPMA